MTWPDMTLWHDNLINRHTHTLLYSLLVGHHGLSRCKGFGPLPMNGGSASLLGHQRLFRGDGHNVDMTREPTWTEDEQNKILLLLEASRFHPNAVQSLCQLHDAFWGYSWSILPCPTGERAPVDGCGSSWCSYSVVVGGFKYFRTLNAKSLGMIIPNAIAGTC